MINCGESGCQESACRQNAQEEDKEERINWLAMQWLDIIMHEICWIILFNFLDELCIAVTKVFMKQIMYKNRCAWIVQSYNVTHLDSVLN